MSIPFFNYRNKPKTVEKKKGNKLIVFANQKGGVGKSTTNLMFANYLSDLGIQLHIVDADPQLSVKTKYDEDLRRFPDSKPLYSLSEFKDLDDEQKTIDAIKKMREEEFDFIIDTPGNLSLQGMVPLLLEADVIITPVQYEETCMESTFAFLNLIVGICNTTGRNSLVPIIFIPNMFNKNWGKKEELQKIKEMEENLRAAGKIAPRIPASPEIRRYSCLWTTKEQKELTSPCFDFLYKNIYSDIIQNR